MVSVFSAPSQLDLSTLQLHTSPSDHVAVQPLWLATFISNAHAVQVMITHFTHSTDFLMLWIQSIHRKF